MKKNKFCVNGIHCGSCISKIEKGLAELEGIHSSEVDKEAGAVVTESSDELSAMAIKTRLEDLGFSVTGFSKL